VRFLISLVLACTVLTPPSPAVAKADDPRFVVESLTENLALPTGIAIAPDGSIFIAEKAGRVKLWRSGVLHGEPVLDIRDSVNDMNDRGLIGIALHPRFLENGYLYLAFVHDPPGAQPDSADPRQGRIVRYTVDRDVARPNSATVILDDFDSSTMQHSVGSLRFASDGALFASFGDGALSQGIQKISLQSQRLDNIQGKLLRIDTLGNGLPGNPYFDAANPRSARSRIWASGFRNPFRFGIEPNSGLPFVGDVGWNTYEWLARATPGANFGWPCIEGAQPIQEFAAAAECSSVQPGEFTSKTLIYAHEGAPASITGGDFNTGRYFPDDTRGQLFFADYSKFWVRRAALDAQGNVTGTYDVIANIGEPVDVQFGPDGALYVLSIRSRGLQRVVLKDKAPAWQAPRAPSRSPEPDIAGAAHNDTLLPGVRTTLKTSAANALWSVTHYEGRRGKALARADGAQIAFDMPKDVSDTGFVEVLLAATDTHGRIQTKRINLYAPHSDGYIRSWHLLGSAPWHDLTTDVIGEAGFELKPGDKRAWLIRSATRNINFRQLLTPTPGEFGVMADKATAYAFVWIESPADRTGLLGMNSDDGLAAWLNGREIWRNKVGRNMPDDLRDIDLPPLTLKKGLNGLLIKVDTNGGDWQFKARVLNADGSIMRDIQIRTAR
jgi:glucose/arabinose dehydrogenase